ncbi:hypothetical protein DPMN_164851 [Dreissena polymorpha]|uniref:Uncharacterized protein n=1 Tax=Dreissena polymorpha TaxID=45954 RepID=A0A9D4IW07_DREPO|nr:hypothetical protein DPMN_164851 [Dreissena polymorpha]
MFEVTLPPFTVINENMKLPYLHLTSMTSNQPRPTPPNVSRALYQRPPDSLNRLRTTSISPLFLPYVRMSLATLSYLGLSEEKVRT